MKKLAYLGLVGAALAIPMKVFVDKVDKEAQNAYQQAQVQLAKINIDRLRML